MTMNRILMWWLGPLWLLALAVQAEQPGVATIAPNVELRLQGIAVAQELRTDYYIGAIYLPEWAADLSQAGSETVPKRMSMKVLVDRLSAREFQRHWKERIALNNARAIWQPQGERILKLAQAFRDNLQRGDRIDFDFLPGQGTRVRLNNQPLVTISGDGFYPLLLSAWLGDIPPTRAFQNALRGDQDSETRAHLVLSFDSIPVADRPLASVAALISPPAPALAAVDKPADKPVSKPAAKPAGKPAPSKAVAAKPADKPVLAARQPAQVAGGAGTAALPPASTSTAESLPVAESLSIAETPSDTETKAAASAEPAIAMTEPVIPASIEPPVDEDLLLGEYKRDALQRIRKQLEYPARAWRLGLTGSGIIRARLDRKGQLLGKDVVVSTGQMILDQAMATMLERSLPLPALPAGVSSDEVVLEIPVDFVR